MRVKCIPHGFQSFAISVYRDVLITRGQACIGTRIINSFITEILAVTEFGTSRVRPVIMAENTRDL